MPKNRCKDCNEMVRSSRVRCTECQSLAVMTARRANGKQRRFFPFSAFLHRQGQRQIKNQGAN